MLECGYDRNLLDTNNPNNTQVLAAKRGVYAKLRALADPEDLIDIEFRFQIKEENHDRSSGTRRNTINKSGISSN